jgi:hypothetical protein
MITFDYPDGATPLDPNEAEGLRLSHITTRGELDRWEQDNILWAGHFRQSDKNIGGPWHQVPTSIQNLCEDARLWIKLQDESPRPNRCPLSSPPRINPSVRQWQRTPRPADDGSSARKRLESSRLHLGRRQPFKVR